jgi:hypothetical protein
MALALTFLFTGAALWFLIGCARPTACHADRITCGAHVVMGAAMVAMIWGTMLPTWLQVAYFAMATFWFAGLATVPHRPAAFRSTHHALMASAMVWMVVTMSIGHISGTAAVSAVLAGYFVLATVPFGYGAIRHKPRAMDAASHAAMSLGTGVLLLSML